MTRGGRGPHSADRELFEESQLEPLRAAVSDLGWLFERGYAEASSLQLVGDRYGLRKRQRDAVRRSACSAAAAHERLRRQVGSLDGRAVAIDGFNCLITIESALAGGVLLRGRDGALRDLASVHGSYRRVATTERALSLLFAQLSGDVTIYLDRPVSNSRRLAGFMREAANEVGIDATIELPFDPDRVLEASPAIVATSDATILDRCGSWIDLPSMVVESSVPEAWIVDLRSG